MDLSDLINRIGIKPSTKRNEALDTYIENSNQKGEKLEILLSEFLRITSDKSVPNFEWSDEVENYYNYIYKNINNLDFSIADMTQLIGNEQLYKTIGSYGIKNSKFGLFLSALINKNIKVEEKIELTTVIRIHFLFYKLENAEAYVNIAGDHLGERAKNSKIYADEVLYSAGDQMGNCELNVKKAGYGLGVGAINSKIYADKAGGNVGEGMKNSELWIYELDGDLQNIRAIKKTNKIYIGEASYKRHYIRYKLSGIKVWKKQD